MSADSTTNAEKKVLIDEIGTLTVVPPGPLAGAKMRNVDAVEDAVIHVVDGRIEWFGPAADAPSFAPQTRISAGGGTVVPGLIDPHTHIPFAGNRSGEFQRRLEGESYLSIMEGGGGIRATTEAVRRATHDQLIAENLPRLKRMLADGVTTAECKSGYGLAPEPELKQLRVIKALDGLQPIELVPTYLGAHAIPAEFDQRPDAFLDAILADEVFAEIKREDLARFCDVFCDRGAFDVDQSRRVLRAAAAAGLRLKLHADELAQIGASKLAGEIGAISADHLELIDDAGIAAMRAAGTIAVVLPGTSFFLGIKHADARGMIEAGLPLALATDLNPGSSHIESLPFVMNIACCQLRLSPAEVLAACTANAAAAIGEQHRLGAIARGFDADLLLLDAPNLASWFYTPGRRRTRAVLKRGRPVFQA